MVRVLAAFIFISVISLNPLPASAQRGGFGWGPGPNPKLVRKKIINKITLYNASEYDGRKSGSLLAHEKLKREMIEAVRLDILSSCRRECPVKSQAVSRAYIALISTLMKNEKGSSRWESGVLEYQYAIGASITNFTRLLCVISNDSDLVETIVKIQKRADDSLAVIHRLNSEPYNSNKQGKYDRAVNTLVAANYLREGIVSDVWNNTDEALDAYEDAIKFCPEFAEAYYQRAETFREKSNKQKAVSDYSRAIRYDKNEMSYYISRGICYTEMGQQENALKDFNHVINIKPSDPVSFKAYAVRGNIHERREEARKALKDYTKATELNRKAAKIFYRKGLLNRKLKNYEDSVKDFNQVIELEKNPADAYYERGTTYAYLGDREKVLDDFKAAAKLGSRRARDFLEKKKISWE